ncbi:MAG: penicillin-binding transpeptidase domain-containing protein, partial [Turicibacter sp.]|nr:penicillin-binding transpeptidase domain-containing protein [Turicibacter sp.]
ATGIGRMVGSTAKPLFPYAIGMEELGWGTGTGFYDEAFTWPTGGTVANWDNRFRGGVTLREAMNMSWNTPAAMGMVQVMNQIGQEGVNEWAQRFGLHVDGTGEPIENIHPAYALGGNTVGWSPLQMAAAYAIFGNGGYYHEPFFVDRVVSPEGEVTYGADMRVSQRVMSEETAYMITSTLRSTMTEGTGVNHANQGLWNMNLAGKTGTNGFGGPAEHAVVGRSVGAHIARDSWFVGFSGQFTTAVWVGYDRMRFGDYMEGFWAQGVSGRVFNQVMRNLNPWGTQLPARPWGIQGRQVEIPYDSGDNFLAVAPGDNVSNNYLRWELFNVNHPRFSITSRERDSSRVEEEEYEEYEYDYEYYDDGYDDGYEGYPADIPHDDGYVPAPDYGYETPAPAPYVPDDTPPPYETGYSDGY